MVRDNEPNAEPVRRFAGTGPDASKEYRSWRKWARAYATVQKARGVPGAARGPLLFTLLDDVAARAVETIDVDDLEVEGGENLNFDVLDERFPDLAAHDRLGEALTEIFS